MADLVITPNLNEFFDTIQSDIKKDMAKGAEEAAKIVPEILLGNFYAYGETGGNARWPNLNDKAMALRKQNNKNYYQRNEPLYDTGKLRSSGTIHKGKTPIIYTIDLGSPGAEYGFGHETGTGVLPWGGHVWERPHMYIPEEQFESVFNAFTRGVMR